MTDQTVSCDHNSTDEPCPYAYQAPPRQDIERKDGW